LLSWNIDGSSVQVQSHNETPGVFYPITQYLLSKILPLLPTPHLPKLHMRDFNFFRRISSYSICDTHSRLEFGGDVPYCHFFARKNMEHQTANLAIWESQTWKTPQVDIKATWHYALRFINMFTSLWPRNLYSGTLS
jgi:hypothetical protein